MVDLHYTPHNRACSHNKTLDWNLLGNLLFLSLRQKSVFKRIVGGSSRLSAQSKFKKMSLEFSSETVKFVTRLDGKRWTVPITNAADKNPRLASTMFVRVMHR